jgi:hypothetical protein
MEATPRQEFERLLVLQQAAGYLNLSVDELLQLQRGPSNSTLTLGGSGSRPPYVRHDSNADVQRYSSFPLQGSDGGVWNDTQHGNVDSQNQQGDPHVLADLPYFATRQLNSDRNTSSHRATHSFGMSSAEEVILLNPEIENAWYACNRDYQMIGFEDISGSDRHYSSGTDGFVHITPNSHESDAESEATARDDDVEMVSVDDDDQTLSITTPADRRSSSSWDSRQYKLLAPKPGTVTSPSTGSSPGASGHKVRKKRAAYSKSHRLDTSLTRSLNACVRCRIQRNRVRNNVPRM